MKVMSDYYKKLLSIEKESFVFTKEQILFLSRNNKDTILRAIPGSGKTTLLAYKVKQLLIEFPNINKIQCISYTNVTVDDLRNKCVEILSNSQLNKVSFSTFHSFCFENIIRPFSHLYFSNGARIYSDIFRWEEHGIDLVAFLKGKNQNTDFLEKNKKYYYNIKLYNDNNIDYASLGETDRLYLSFLKSRKIIDFNLLVYFSMKLIIQNEIIRKVINSSFDYICIDEFQDVSEMQYKIITSLIQSKPNPDLNPYWLLIGDPNQSIYGFAGAKMSSMFDIKTLLGDENEIVLKKSFRCSGKVFKSVSELYNANLDKFIVNLDARNSNFLQFLTYLKVENNIECNNEFDGDIYWVDDKKVLTQGQCFIGSDKFDVLSTYSQHKQTNLTLFQDDEYLIFENMLDNYKDKFGYRFINLYTQYLLVKYNFQFAINEYQDSLEIYRYMFEKLLNDELMLKIDNIETLDYCLKLNNYLDETLDLFQEYKNFHNAICNLLNWNHHIQLEPIKDWMGSEVSYNTKVCYADFMNYIKKRKENTENIEIQHLHKIKGLQFREILIKTDKIPHRSLFSKINPILNNQRIAISNEDVLKCIEELNRLYVMMTRSESNVYILNTNNSKSIFLSGL